MPDCEVEQPCFQKLCFPFPQDCERSMVLLPNYCLTVSWRHHPNFALLPAFTFKWLLFSLLFFNSIIYWPQNYCRNKQTNNNIKKKMQLSHGDNFRLGIGQKLSKLGVGGCDWDVTKVVSKSTMMTLIACSSNKHNEADALQKLKKSAWRSSQTAVCLLPCWAAAVTQERFEWQTLSVGLTTDTVCGNLTVELWPRQPPFTFPWSNKLQPRKELFLQLWSASKSSRAAKMQALLSLHWNM